MPLPQVLSGPQHSPAAQHLPADAPHDSPSLAVPLEHAAGGATMLAVHVLAYEYGVWQPIPQCASLVPQNLHVGKQAELVSANHASRTARCAGRAHGLAASRGCA